MSAASAPSALRKILIVDDDINGSHMYARWLKLDGFTVEIATTAETGFYQAQLTRPDAIILDLHMPLIDGVGFLRRLRAHDGLRDIPVAIATGDLIMDESVAKELKSLGAQISYKPLIAEEIVALARNLVEVRH